MTQLPFRNVITTLVWILIVLQDLEYMGAYHLGMYPYGPRFNNSVELVRKTGIEDVSSHCL